jgi:hypothetical protein
MDVLKFYSTAQRDRSFREQRLGEARYHKKMAVGLAVALGSAWLCYAVYCATVERRWPGDLGLGLALVLCASLYSHARTKIGALEAMQNKEPDQQPPQPTPPSGATHL